jgi:hypothetical protein
LTHCERANLKQFQLSGNFDEQSRREKEKAGESGLCRRMKLSDANGMQERKSLAARKQQQTAEFKVAASYPRARYLISRAIMALCSRCRCIVCDTTPTKEMQGENINLKLRQISAAATLASRSLEIKQQQQQMKEGVLMSL